MEPIKYALCPPGVHTIAKKGESCACGKYEQQGDSTDTVVRVAAKQFAALREEERINGLGHVNGRTGTRREEDRTNPKAALGATKPMLGLNPPVALLHMAKAFEFGAHGRDANGVQVRPKGYGEFNWRNTDIAEMVYVHAALRHWADYLDGEDVASDSKVKHLGHIMACCAILLDAEECGTLVRNRPPKGKAASLIERMTIKTPVANTIEIKGLTGLSEKELDNLINRFFNLEAKGLERKLYHGLGLEGLIPSDEIFPRKRTRRQAHARQGQKRKGGSRSSKARK